MQTHMKARKNGKSLRTEMAGNTKVVDGDIDLCLDFDSPSH